MKKAEFVPGALVELYQNGRSGEKPLRVPGEILTIDPEREKFTMLSFFYFVHTTEMHMDEAMFRPIAMQDALAYIAEREKELNDAVNEVTAIRKMYAPGSPEWEGVHKTCLSRVQRLIQFRARSREWIAKTKTS